MIVVIILQPISPCNFNGSTPAISSGEPLVAFPLLIEATERNITVSLVINVDGVIVLYAATSGSIKVVS